jgi:hypothetical protein
VTFESALLARLVGDEELNAATGGRIDFGRTFTALPAISLQIVSDPRPQHFKGFHSTRATDVQVDIWAKTVETGAPLREQVIALLVANAESEGVQFQRAMITNVRAGAEQQQSGPVPVQRVRAELHRTSIDITFTHDA